MNIAAASIPPAITGGISAIANAQGADPAASEQFLDIVNNSLKNVSDLQARASSAEQSFAAGTPGATLGKALVSSDRAEVAWSATVAVRNEVVSAYSSIMNMQF